MVNLFNCASATVYQYSNIYIFFQINVSYPANGTQTLIEVEDEIKLRNFYDKRMSQEVSAECLGDEWKVNSYVFKILKLTIQ